jgi:hypothetical protein
MNELIKGFLSVGGFPFQSTLWREAGGSPHGEVRKIGQNFSFTFLTNEKPLL